MDDPFDRDLVAVPPSAITSVEYERCFEAYVELATGCLDSSLPKRPKGSARGQLLEAFRANYRALYRKHRIAIPKEGEPPGRAAEIMDGFQPAVVFVTEGRELIVPETYLVPSRRVRDDTSEWNADSAAACLTYEIISVIDKSISPYGPSLDDRRKTCEDTAWALAMWFDDDSLETTELIDQDVAPVFSYVDDRNYLVLIPAVTPHHEYLHGNLDLYFSEQGGRK